MDQIQLTGIDITSGKPLVADIDIDEFYQAIDDNHTFTAKTEEQAIARDSPAKT